MILEPIETDDDIFREVYDLSKKIAHYTECSYIEAFNAAIALHRLNVAATLALDIDGISEHLENITDKLKFIGGIIEDR
jgi:hypothetical protein